jgi:hypothetical protein
MPAGKLGKLAPKKHKLTLRFEDFRTPVDPNIPPPKRAWEYVIADDKWGMYGNNVKGDCTLAAKAHIIMCITANAGALVVPDPAEIVGIYDQLSPDDTGLAMTDVYDYWLKNPIAGQKLAGWVQIDQTNDQHFDECVNLFGACDTGIQLPQSAIDEFNAGQNWEFVNPTGGIAGGHDVPYLGFGRLGKTCITWSRRQPCGNAFVQNFCDEAYAPFLESWFDTAGAAPNGFNRDALWNALQALKAA